MNIRICKHILACIRALVHRGCNHKQVLLTINVHPRLILCIRPRGVLFIDVQTCSLLMNPEPKGQLFFPKIPKGQLKIQTNQNSKGVDCLTSYYKHLWGHELSLLRHGGHHAQQGSTQPAIADNFFFFLQGVKLPLGSGHPFNPCHKLFQCKIIIHSPHSVYNSGPKNQ